MSNFKFNISLSVLNHLGRSLYRNFITVLGEAISNSWDADATVVDIFLDKEKNRLIIKDNGCGMDDIDFQEKFLKIGYSKRKDTNSTTTEKRERPYIGRKGIGKLALLSCAERVNILSKKKGGKIIGGAIDNGGLDHAIQNDLTPEDYPLEDLRVEKFNEFLGNFDNGTILLFENLNDGISGSEEQLRKLLALSFKFSIVDPDFKINFNGKKVSEEDLRTLIDKTQFVWQLNGYEDRMVKKIENKNRADKEFDESVSISVPLGIKGFIASVKKPSDLNVRGTGSKISIDLFVNGRLRERGIMKHLSTARIAASYFYGQIHFDALEGSKDNFTSSREGIKQDSKEFQQFLKDFKNIVNKIIDDWDILRGKYKDDGDPESERLTPKERKAEELTNVISKEYKNDRQKNKREKSNSEKKENPGGINANLNQDERDIVDDWIDELAEEARYNIESYAECFIAENLARKYINHKSIVLSDKNKDLVKEYRKREKESKEKGNISIQVRVSEADENYLDMGVLAHVVDSDRKNEKDKTANLYRDAAEYKPLRDAMAHTSTLTRLAKNKLTTTFENIKHRIKTKLNDL